MFRSEPNPESRPESPLVHPPSPTWANPISLPASSSGSTRDRNQCPTEHPTPSSTPFIGLFNELLDTGVLPTPDNPDPNHPNNNSNTPRPLVTRERETLRQIALFLRILSRYLINPRYQKRNDEVTAIMDDLYNAVENAHELQDLKIAQHLAVEKWRKIECEQMGKTFIALKGNTAASAEEETQEPPPQTYRAPAYSVLMINHSTNYDADTEEENYYDWKNGRRGSISSSDYDGEIFVAREVTLTRVSRPKYFTLDPFPASIIEGRQKEVDAEVDVMGRGGDAGDAGMNFKALAALGLVEGGEVARTDGRIHSGGRSFASMIPPTARAELEINDGPMAETCFQARVETQLSLLELEKAPGLEEWYCNCGKGEACECRGEQ